MSDNTINTSTFTHAYRKYAVEQGHDPGQAAFKSAEATDHAVSVRQLAKAVTIDTVVISPAAQHAFVEQNLRTRTVNRSNEGRPVGSHPEQHSSELPEGSNSGQNQRASD